MKLKRYDRETGDTIRHFNYGSYYRINADCFYKNICKRINFRAVFAEKIMTKKLSVSI